MKVQQGKRDSSKPFHLYRVKSLLPLIGASFLVVSCDGNNATDSQNTDIPTPTEKNVPYFQDWPEIQSAIPKDEKIEIFIAEILSQMTIEEKIGQMIQPDLREVTPEEAEEYKLGSILNGGGGWPGQNKYATAQDWANEADKYYLAIENAYEGRGFRVPFMWGTDAVHGHNNVFSATVFPHNIGLGAARDPDLIYRIGQATAREVAATGLDWTFAPTVATPRDDRWGRTYEGYSEDPEIVYQYAGKMVEGIQGSALDLKGDTHVISNVKHFIGDGGTLNGVDRGRNLYSEDQLINIHATGYFSGLDAGAQVVMASFNSWENEKNYAIDDASSGQLVENYNGKIHGSKYLLTDVLKDKMGFDGLVVSDWNGHTEINNCQGGSCAAAVNAGIDIIMVTARGDWKNFYNNLLAQVRNGVVSEQRIDDAVLRILRVKARAGLWDKPKPSERSLAGQANILGGKEHRDLAREAVSKSLVLLKNNDQLLPLARDQKILLAGSASDNIMKQTGGWSISWQGDGNTIDDFPGAKTFKMALASIIDEENIVTDVSLMPEGGTAIVVIGEDPYAEMFGDIKANQTLEFAKLKNNYLNDSQLVKDLKLSGFNVVTVFYSGRPLYVNEEINHSDAFVAAFLPGTEADGITDVLFKNEQGNINKSFTGKLSFTWPNNKCATTINRALVQTDISALPDFEQALNEDNVLFDYGYGLQYGQNTKKDLDNLPLDARDYGCGQDKPSDSGIATDVLELFGRDAITDQYRMLLSGSTTSWGAQEVSRNGEVNFATIITTPINYKHQQDALAVNFTGDDIGGAQIYLQTPDTKGIDLQSYKTADSTLQFDILVESAPLVDSNLSIHCEHPCLGEVKLTAQYMQEIAAKNEWQTIKVPLSCFDGLDFSRINTPFLIWSKGQMKFNLGNIRWVPRTQDPALDAWACN